MTGRSGRSTGLPSQAGWWIEVERDQRAASVKVDAPTVAAPELAQLADLLDWLLTVGSTEIYVDLGGLPSVDAALLEVLHAVQERLEGDLTATARCAEAHRTLFLTGLSHATCHA